MQRKTGHSLAAAILLFTLLTACSTNSEIGTSSENLTAPPVEGNGSAPTLEAAASPKYQPSGVLVSPTDETSLFVYSPSAEFIASLETPGVMVNDPATIHIAGSMSAGGSTPPLVYRSWEPEQAIMVNENGIVNPLRNTTTFLALSGAAGQPVLAFSEVTIDDNLPHSFLYAENLDALSEATPFYDLRDEYTHMALMPVAVNAAAGNPEGVWYTLTAWGIGGADLIYPITRGLYYYDLNSNENLQYLEPDRNFQGISFDMQLAGSVAFDSKGDRSMNVTNLTSGQSTAFPLKGSSDRGAGYAVFSHDNQYAAWLEASGSLIDEPVSYRSLVCIANLNNAAVEHEVEDTNIAQLLGIDRISFMKSVGWLDGQTVLIEVRGENWGQVQLVSYNLTDDTLSFFCEGSFAGLIYP
jgi:hypothetical protein